MIVSKSMRSSSKARTTFGKRHRGVRHLLSIPNDTVWGSDEAIVTVERDVKKGVQGRVGGEALQKVDKERETECVEDRGRARDCVGP
jgi:hypothetical protein